MGKKEKQQKYSRSVPAVSEQTAAGSSLFSEQLQADKRAEKVQISAASTGQKSGPHVPEFGSLSPDLAANSVAAKTAANPEIITAINLNEGETSSIKSVTLGSVDSFDSESILNGSQSNPAMKQSWAQKVANSRRLDEGFTLKKLDFDDKVFELDPADLASVKEVYGPCLLGCFAGGFPGFTAFKQLCKGWNVPYSFFKHNSGWIVITFEHEIDRDAVFAGGPYFAFGRPLILKSMPACFQIDKAQDLNMVPVWIKLPGLPPDMWTEPILSKLGSRVGTPISTDSNTRLRKKFGFARLLVEVDASKELTRCIDMRLLNGETRKQVVDFEFVPKYCVNCKQLGHTTSGCEARTAALNAKFLGKSKKAEKKDSAPIGGKGDVPSSQPGVGTVVQEQVDASCSKAAEDIPASAQEKTAVCRKNVELNEGAEVAKVSQQASVPAPNSHIFFASDDEADPGQPSGSKETPFIEVVNKKRPKKVSYVLDQKAAVTAKAAKNHQKSVAKQKDKGRGNTLPKYP